jgi:glyoxylase-like metal-dependent hydrolase (beta-lactamase superfamily II)
MIHVKKFVVNPLAENSYLLYDETGEAIFIDPGFYYGEEEDEVKEYIDKKSLNPVKIVNTHCHFDHILGVEFLRREYRIPFYAHSADFFWVEQIVEKGKIFGFQLNPVSLPEGELDDLNEVRFGNSAIEIIKVPGHSPGHVVLYSKSEGFLISGDVLFYGSIGRTDFQGGNYNTLISGIKNKILVLPPSTKVFCGHGPETTIGFEAENNPFLT